MSEDQPLIPQAHDPLAAVKIPEYKHLVLGRFCFILALRMMTTVVGWWIYELTSDPFAIGLIGLSEVIPALSLALYSGHVIDQSEKRKLMLRGVVCYFIAACTLLFYPRVLLVRILIIGSLLSLFTLLFSLQASYGHLPGLFFRQ